jgi:hypothetical protein
MVVVVVVVVVVVNNLPTIKNPGEATAIECSSLS